jgi:hypothetical protein
MSLGYRYVCMEQNLTAEQANSLMSLALQLRQAAFETEDGNYIELFLSAALALEARAYQGASASSVLVH